MANAGTVEVNFAAETAKFTAELKKVRGELKTLQTSVSSIGTTLGKVGTALKGFAIGATVIAAIRATAKATAESEAAVAQLDSALKSAGQNVETQSPKFQQFAANMQGVTTFTDEAVIGVETLLLSFKGLSGDTVLRASAAVLDVSTRLGTDLKAASIGVGKALQDPIGGLTALQRAGVKFTDSQKALIRQLVNSGESAKAQGIILSELEKRFGGAAEAARNNFSGALTGVQNALGDLLEAKGGLPEATANMNELARVLQDPGVKAGADAIFSTLIRGAAGAADLIGKTAAGLAIMAGKGGNAIVDLDKQIEQLEAKRKRILTSAGGDVSLLGPGFRKEFEDANRQIDDLLKKQRQLLQIVEFSPKRSLAQGGHGAILSLPPIAEETPEARAARITQELAIEKTRLAVSLQNIQQLSAETDRILDEIVEKEKPILAAREESRRVFAERELDIVVEEFDRKLELERQFTDAKAEELRKQSALAARQAEEEKQVRSDLALHSIAVGAFILQGAKNHQKALEIANKASTIRQIAIDTRAAAARALKYFGPTPVGYAAAAAAIAFGALQIKGVLAASTSFNVGAGGGAQSQDAIQPEQSVAPTQQQSAVTVHINGYISKSVVDDMIEQLDDRFRGGTVIIRPNSNQADAIRRAT